LADLFVPPSTCSELPSPLDDFALDVRFIAADVDVDVDADVDFAFFDGE